MIFRLVEDLEQKLSEKDRNRKHTVGIVSSTLSELGFVESKELNGVSFNKEIDAEDSTFYCEFYLDLDNNKYKSYVSNDSDNKVMFTQEGDIEDADDAVGVFSDFLGSI